MACDVNASVRLLHGEELGNDTTSVAAALEPELAESRAGS
jgi:hypothetical protein